MSPPRNRRRIKLIRPGLQLRMAAAFGGICALALLVQSLVLSVELVRLAGRMPGGSEYLTEALPGILGAVFVWSALLVMPALLVLGIRITFRVAGPLTRFQRHFEAIERGEQPGECRLRAGDELQDLCQLMNRAFEETRRQGIREGRGELERAA